MQRTISKWLHEEKVIELDTANDCLNMLRRAGSQKHKSLFYKDIRPHLLAEEVSFKCDENSPDFGTLMVSGYLRGTTPLSVNDLVHIPGFGNFPMSCIKLPEDPYLIEHERKRYFSDDKTKMERRSCETVILADPEKQVS